MSIQHYKVGKVGKPAYKTTGLTDSNCRQSVELQAARYADYMLANQLQHVTVWHVTDKQPSDNYNFRAALFSHLYKHHTGIDTTRTTYRGGRYFVYTLAFMRTELTDKFGYTIDHYRPDDIGGHVDNTLAQLSH